MTRLNEGCCGNAACGAQDEVNALGQLGPVLFILTVLVAELIPLFPTQPLALSAGLLFGPIEVTHLLILSLSFRGQVFRLAFDSWMTHPVI